MRTFYTVPIIFFLLFVGISCKSQNTTKKTTPHQYGGWYCPDNFGFEPVDIQKLSAIPAVVGRLPSKEELQNNESLISVDTEKHPDAHALDIPLPKVASIYADRTGQDELIIVIQAIVVSGDTIVGYRFPNGGNGSAWLSDITFLSDQEVSDLGSQPFYFNTTVLNASKEKVWQTLTATDYFSLLGDKFDKQEFFSSEWTADSRAHLHLESEEEHASGFVGTHFGNTYLHIDYYINSKHYSEKILLIENNEEGTTKMFFASGPFPSNYDAMQKKWDKWFYTVQKAD